MSWAPDYVTPEELKAFLRFEAGDDLDDAQIGPAIAAASRAVDRCTHRQFGLVAAPEVRLFTARQEAARGAQWVVDIDDLMTSVGLVVEFDGEAITDHRMRPVNAPAVARPWECLVVLSTSDVTPTGAEAAVSVTARWGWTEVPEAVKQATLLQANRMLARRNSPFGIAGSPDAGSEMRLLSKVDPDVEVALADYKRRSRRPAGHGRPVVFA